MKIQNSIGQNKKSLFYSLQQIVLLAFVLVLLPLLWLAYQSYDGLLQLSEKSSEINRNTAIYARRIEVMTNVVLEIERSSRQFCILNDETFLKLHEEQKEQYSKMLEAHKPVFSDLSLYNQIKKILENLTTLSCDLNRPEASYAEYLEQLSISNNLLSQATRAEIFSRGEALQLALTDRAQNVGQQALLLCLISFILVLLFTRMITRPVNAISQMVNNIGEGKQIKKQRIYGPRELEQLANRIVWLSERLNWLESQRHEFLRHVSHELKTPLASLREGTELLADEVAGVLTLEQKEVVKILDSSSKDLQHLIEQLLEYNRQAIVENLTPVEVNLESLIDKTVKAHELLVKNKNVELLVDIKQSYIKTDFALLSRVIDNLYSNAVHYVNDSGTIFIKTVTRGNYVIIDIANTGSNIPIEEREMIFEPFYQGKTQRKGAVKGSGLGLSIAYNAVRRLDGDLIIEDIDYADVCFSIRLPLLKQLID